MIVVEDILLGIEEIKQVAKKVGVHERDLIFASSDKYTDPKYHFFERGTKISGGNFEYMSFFPGILLSDWVGSFGEKISFFEDGGAILSFIGDDESRKRPFVAWNYHAVALYRRPIVMSNPHWEELAQVIFFKDDITVEYPIKDYGSPKKLRKTLKKMKEYVETFQINSSSELKKRAERKRIEEELRKKDKEELERIDREISRHEEIQKNIANIKDFDWQESVRNFIVPKPVKIPQGWVVVAAVSRYTNENRININDFRIVCVEDKRLAEKIATKTKKILNTIKNNRERKRYFKQISKLGEELETTLEFQEEFRFVAKKTPTTRRQRRHGAGKYKCIHAVLELFELIEKSVSEFQEFYKQRGASCIDVFADIDTMKKWKSEAEELLKAFDFLVDNWE